MTQSPFFTDPPMPVFDHLSAGTKRALEQYFQSGNAAFRQKRMREFFKMLDWLAPGEEYDPRTLDKLPSGLRRQLMREVDDYRMHKAARRVENSEKREQYRLRIFEYFRRNMPAADKLLLERLRDYELDLTGRDVNWRHYFTFDSFKKIDAFIEADFSERQALIERFRKDVDTYKRNYDKLHNARQHGHTCDHGFSFDDWCDMMGDSNPHREKQGHSRGKTSATTPPNPIYQAYQTLNLDLNAPMSLVKKQYRQLALTHHPDRPNGSEEKMKAIINAYQAIRRYVEQSADLHAR